MSTPERSILVVENERLVATTVAEQLRYLGYEPEIAVSGTEALQLLRTGEFSIILTDYRLQDILAPELITQFRALKDGIRVVLSSGLGPEIEADFRPGEIDGFLHKPYGLTELREVLGQIETDLA
ncbi:MAG: response regulator [Planctomycetota bacterium]